MSETQIPVAHTGSVAGESFVALRTNLFGAGRNGHVRTLLVTSPTEDSGKTTIAINLAHSAAQADIRTLLVDGDMRKRRVSVDLGLGEYPGLSTLLTKPGYLSRADRLEVEQAKSVVLPAGPVPPSSADLLSSGPLKILLQGMAERFSFVCIDSPPVLAVIDASILGVFVDAVVLVVDLKTTKRRELKQTLEVLRRVNANVVGLVVNRAAGGYLEYSHYKGYGMR